MGSDATDADRALAEFMADHRALAEAYADGDQDSAALLAALLERHRLAAGTEDSR